MRNTIENRWVCGVLKTGEGLFVVFVVKIKGKGWPGRVGERRAEWIRSRGNI